MNSVYTRAESTPGRPQFTELALRILHTNDMHGTLQGEALKRLHELRSACDLYFDSGDAIQTGNLGIPLRPEPVWPLLSALACTASVLGNRETHLLETAFEAKLAGAGHPILCANITKRDGSRPLPSHVILNDGGVRVGIVAVMVPMVTMQMTSKRLSAYLWDPPVDAAKRLATELRPEVDLLIALTHVGYRQDLVLAEQCQEFDAILGGHSHTVLQEPEAVGHVAVCQGGSHNRFAGVYEWSIERGWTGGLVALRAT